MEKELRQKFEELYGAEGEIRAYFAPGRVNLIGDHTDYNGGHVFPCALSLGTYGLARKRKDRRFRLYSLNFKESGVLEGSFDELACDERSGWGNYPKGVFWAFQKRGYALENGMDVLIYGDIPNGAGLSSSASLEVLTGFMLKDLLGLSVSKKELALIGQYSENEYNGCNCGIMDQFTVAMGKEGCAVFLDTNTLEYEYAPIGLKEESLIITNSRVKHSLVDSAYNERRKECEAALRELQTAADIKSLGELTQEKYESIKSAIKDETRRKRAKHAVYENARTIRAAKALREGDIELFGRLMRESHISLRDDYEVSCKEIDFLVEKALNIEGVFGSRITGGGFGGCTVSIVRKDCEDIFIKTLEAQYGERFGKRAEFYIAAAGAGVCRLDAEK